MTDWSVGAGILAAMADHGDEPRSDENFIQNEPEGEKISQCYGKLNVYYWMEADNAICVVPFRG